MPWGSIVTFDLRVAAFFTSSDKEQYKSQKINMTDKKSSRPVARGSWGSSDRPNSKRSTNFIVPLAYLVSASMRLDRLSALAMLHVHYMHKIDLLEVEDKFLLRNIQDARNSTVCAPLTLIFWDYLSTRPNCRSTYLLTVQWFSSVYSMTPWMTSV